MAKKKKKAEVNYAEYYSDEVKQLIKRIEETYMQDYSCKSISCELFMLAALSDEETMAYMCLSECTSIKYIDEIKLYLLASIESDDMNASKHQKKGFSLSPQLSKSIALSYDEMGDLFGDSLIYSDMLMYAILVTCENVYAIFAQYLIDDKRIVNNSIYLRKQVEQNKYLALWANEGAGNQVIVTSSDANISELIGAKQQGINEKSVLEQFTTNLNELAKEGKIDELIGRENEIRNIEKILYRRKSNNVLLVGESGVGKTHIVNGIARMIEDRTIEPGFPVSKILQLNTSEMFGGTQYRGIFEERIASLSKELNERQDVILFIDDIDKMMSEKMTVDFDMVNALSDIFRNDKIMVIATTTPKGYKNNISKNPVMSSTFQKLTIDPPTQKECIDILNYMQPYYERYHHVKYYDGFVKDCVSLCNRYVTDRKLPTSALDIMDESGILKYMAVNSNVQIKGKTLELKRLVHLNEINKLNEDVDGMNSTKKNINKTLNEITLLSTALSEENTGKLFDVTIDDLYSAVSEHTGIPVSKMSVSEKKSVANIDKRLKESIIGQDNAIETISRSIKRNKVGLFDGGKPVGSYLCVGNSGVGKTLLAKTLAKEIYGGDKYLVRFDMSEYSDKTSVNKLIGAAAGYVGFDQGGLLTEAVKKNKHCVLLIDEVEKANDEVFNLFLQIMDEGFLTDNEGVKVDFKNTMIIFTSNVGTREALSSKALGFNPDQSENNRSVIEKELKRKFPPEFVNRLTEIVYFNQLSDDDLHRIIELELGKLVKRLTEIGYNLAYDDSVVDSLFNKLQKSKEYGARPITRLIQSEIENRITDLILENDYDSYVFTVKVNDGELSVE